MTSDRVVSDLMLPCVGRGPVAFSGVWDSERVRRISSQWNVPGRYGRMVTSIPVKACAWFGLHMMSEEDLAGGQRLLLFVGQLE